MSVAAKTITSFSFRHTKGLKKLYPEVIIQPARYLLTTLFRPYSSSDDVDIPEKKISFSYSLSSGPGRFKLKIFVIGTMTNQIFKGGQNVQKVATKVEARFHVDSADWLPGEVKEKLTQQKKLTNDGYLITTSGFDK
jgi:hypothetical protein